MTSSILCISSHFTIIMTLIRALGEGPGFFLKKELALTLPACCGGCAGLPSPAGQGGSLAGPAGAKEQVEKKLVLMHCLFGARSRCVQASPRPVALRVVEARQILPLRSCEVVQAKPSLRSPFMSGRLYCLASTESKSCLSFATSALAISVFTRLLDKSVKLVLQTTLPVLPAITKQPGFLWFVVRTAASRGSLSAPAPCC